jgi:hypothetical protein
VFSGFALKSQLKYVNERRRAREAKIKANAKVKLTPIPDKSGLPNP